jgi:hypothetical protein
VKNPRTRKTDLKPHVSDALMPKATGFKCFADLRDVTAHDCGTRSIVHPGDEKTKRSFYLGPILVDRIIIQTGSYHSCCACLVFNCNSCRLPIMFAVAQDSVDGARKAQTYGPFVMFRPDR